MYTLLKLSKRGFSLVEIIVVIAIIGILAGVIMASVSTARGNARDAKRLSELSQLQVVMKLYKEAYGAYPDCPDGYIFDTESIDSGSCNEEDKITDWVQENIPSGISDPQSGAEHYYRYDSHYECGSGNWVVALQVPNTDRPGTGNMEEVCNCAGDYSGGRCGNQGDSSEAMHIIILE